jgi:hypothetical protein
MAYLAKKGNRYYICESYQVPKLDDKGLPIKDAEDKIIHKNKINGYHRQKIKNLLK